jgi:protein-S-isoprenylcysteine O-methyltransferase Ste14
MPEARSKAVEFPPDTRTDREAFGFKYRGWAGIVVLIPLVVVTLLAQPLLPERPYMKLLLTSAAWVVFLVGAAFRFWSTLYVGGRKRSMVVREGPYSICRNPLYVGSLLIAISGALFAESLTLAIGIALTSMIYALGAVPAEERYLRQTLGEHYEKYRATVPRYLPKPGLYKSSEVIEVHLRGLRVETRRAMKWMWLPVVGLAIAFLRVQPWWPHIHLRLP